MLHNTNSNKSSFYIQKEEDKTDNILYKRHLAQTAKVYYSIKKVY